MSSAVWPRGPRASRWPYLTSVRALLQPSCAALARLHPATARRTSSPPRSQSGAASSGGSLVPFGFRCALAAEPWEGRLQLVAERGDEVMVIVQLHVLIINHDPR